MANVTFNNTNSPTTVAASSLSHAYSVTAGQSNLCAFAVLLFAGTTPSITSVTYGGAAMTSCGAAFTQSGAVFYLQAFYLPNPLTGSNTLAVTGSAGVVEIYANVVSCYNVNQTTPVRPATYTTGSTATGSITNSIPSATTDITIGVVGDTSGALSTNQTIDGGTGVTANSDHCTTPASTITDTWSGGTGGNLTAIGFSVQPFVPPPIFMIAR
jgi:hypothetical protein